MVTERTEDSFLHCEFMVVLPRKAGDVQTPPKFSDSPVSRGYKYHVHPVSKGQARTLSCFVVCFFFRLPPSGLLSLWNRYLLRCDKNLLFCLSAKVQHDSGGTLSPSEGECT